MSERYQRHGLIDWFDQERVRNARIIVVGAGAVGNEVLKNLALLGVGHLHILDFDRIEEHNLTKCVLFRESDIGQTKAGVAAEACRRLDPNMSITATCADFWDALSLREIAASDAVVCCVDNFEARVGLNRLCRMTSTDFYNTGIDSRHAMVEVYPFATEPACACYECNLPASAYATMQRRYSCGWLKKVAFEERKIPTTVVTSSLAGAVASSLLLNRLHGNSQVPAGAIRYFQDSITLSSTLSVATRNEDCPACAADERGLPVIAARRSCAGDGRLPLGPGVEGEVVFSEPVLLRGTCCSCGRVQDYVESARKLNDAVNFCSACGTTSVRTEFAERVALGDFAELFSERNVPVKFVTCQVAGRRVVVEMED